MNNDLTNQSCPTEKDEAACSGRRQFLVRATTGGLVLSLAGAAKAQDKQKMAMPAAEEMVLKLAADSPLNKAGGSQTVDTKAGKVIIARAAEGSFLAYVAKCPHSGGPINYDAKAKQFSCPWHGSTFDEAGQRTGGPTKRPLKSVPTQTALIIGAPTA
jgi:Rieske Fe-S protein